MTFLPSVFSSETFNSATLFVPVGTIDAYKATDGWKNFKNIEEMNAGDGISGIAADRQFKATWIDGQLTVTGAYGCTVRVYDLLGRELGCRRAARGTVTLRVPQAEAYIVSVTGGDGQTVVRKVTPLP